MMNASSYRITKILVYLIISEDSDAVQICLKLKGARGILAIFSHNSILVDFYCVLWGTEWVWSLSIYPPLESTEKCWACITYTLLSLQPFMLQRQIRMA